MGYFNFNTFNPATETQQMLNQRRANAQAIAARIGMGQPSLGNGIGDLFRGLAAGLSNYQTDQNQQAGNAYGQSLVNSIPQPSAVDSISKLLSQPAAGNGPSNAALVESGSRRVHNCAGTNASVTSIVSKTTRPITIIDRRFSRSE